MTWLARLAKRPVKAAVRLGLRPEPIRRLVRQELVERRSAAPEPTGPSGVFIDRYGTALSLDPAIRDRLKPGWQAMLDPEEAARPPSDKALTDRAVKAAAIVREAEALVASVTGSGLSGSVLEIGCYDGAVGFELARRPDRVVAASDLARYYVLQRPGEAAEPDVTDQQDVLTAIRERARSIAGVDPGSVRFVEDDITATALDPASFDAIVSFEVLEHLASPVSAFVAMARLLKPGGIAYHDYNPFFSAKGGHSLCTLDVAWGHARLDEDDFERYLREIRPSEVDQALRFYRGSLNRMTMADLRGAIEGAGLELLAMVPWTDRTLVPRLTSQVVAEVGRTYPGAGLDDLLATFVSVVARRPANPGA